METPRSILRQCRLFRDLPPGILEGALLPRGRLREFEKQAVLIAPGDRVDWFAIVLRGKAQISQIFSDGTSSLMDALGPGYPLGTDLICTRSRRSPYYAIAAGPLQILQFPGTLLLEPGALPEETRMVLQRNLLTILSDSNLRKHYRLAILAQRGLRDRVLVYLTMQAERRGTHTFRIPFSREELAAFLCVNRSALSHELSLMEAEGLIRFRKNEFTLLAEGRGRSAWSVVE
ncbi:MAG: Crp/Fnr family transcriptional regulator [Oscillibacter sp.]|nr:Crp/Fnr family transcriptional regulator [Oscillibacter sp.]